ncbi:glycosyltransferase family 2 protein [Clostridium cochlearium]|uniref:glycosyltransferase family 2 protein n=1 Tax=Clostridium cochlearium TaxID=1494 RepID=UPI00156F5832|nr:glycosyltransferase family 2 protein [Clostridium cochlearium]MBV1817954.1 glycosyltransferase family 2 protein [Bacteroidales bacterium MSK.15.36]MCG4571355.1 glycosyltransferase family 2 protein [Clostridium cochlearium]MCG4580004.1 glycosyltransferase family 2 protein [Clostridium cochlearium]NSJ90596.1 glycosyltransferase family 2 protein [Coprococcus sp. MSK.21.13]
MIRVQVLLSSYNGKKYIRQQLDSIFNQYGVEVFCLVRDDGSTDNTVDILFEYKKKYTKLEVVRDNNIGYKKSFMRLVEISGEYDYYAFADQDDVWKPDKLLKAIEKINKVQDNLPVMYCSNCIVVDENLNYLSMLHNCGNILPNNKVKALVQGFAHGCTMVFNYEARKLILKYKPKQEYAHDFWIPILLMFLGKIIYDENSYILYRQHGDNCFGSESSIKKIIKFKTKRFINKDFYYCMINEILIGYGGILKLEDQLMLKEIVEYKNSFYNKIRLLFNNKLEKNTLKGTLFLKILILLSRF